MQSLLLSTRKSQFLQLPNTRYGANGEISNAYWSKDVNYDLSPNQSTISLLNPHNRYTWDNKYNKNGTAMSHTSSFRPTYPLNGIRKAASMEPIETGTVSPNLHITPLFNLDHFYSVNDLEETFIGREWVFREIYQSSIVEKVPITIIQGASGAGKSSILNQLILNSSFYPVQASDTLDSGCVPDSGSSLSCRNYEWLRAHSDLQSLLNVNNCLKHNSLDVFKKTIAEPLGQLKSSDQGSLVIVIDGLDEAEFHRSENGRSIDDVMYCLSTGFPGSLLPFRIISIHIESYCFFIVNSFVKRALHRNGHILLALYLTHRSPLNSNELFELAHHLLKAHPYKYMNGEYIPELTSSKDGQILWIQKSSCDITTSLLNLRNMHYPNTKISRLLLLAGADPNSADTDGTVAQQACAAGHWELLSLLLQHGAQVHPKLGSSLLTIAAKNGHLHLVHMLHPMDGMRSISAAVINAAQEGHLQILSFLLGCKWPNSELRAKTLEDAVTAAAGAGHTPICQYLVDSFASMDIKRAMSIACEKGQADTVQFFLSR
uniref:ANK_REP_REGION domain-containing protein n=1 Tax=Heterorhabditis bacteriophora TaxID=37862 RepID=A0A1I7WKR9_HETBA